MIGNEEQDAFVSGNKWAVVTTLRSNGTPSSSVIFYAREGDEILFSTTEDRLKAKTLERDPRIAVCVIDEGPPYRYVTIEGHATLQRDNIVPAHITINKAMRGGDFTPPEGFEERLRQQRRLIVRVRPERVSGVTRR
ncbi:MAG: PPOX class F420-dependent oxidoreductase [Dehalococcoidia bacterium]